MNASSLRASLFALLGGLCLHAQSSTPVSSAPAPTAPVSGQPVPALIPWLPKSFDSAGLGYSSPNSKFGYVAHSEYVGQGTYWTVAIEETFNYKNVQTCTLAGATKLLWQWSVVTAGVTGLGGACVSTTGSAIAAAAAQPFVDIRWGKLALGNTVTGEKLTSGGWKVTLGFRRTQ